MHRAPLVPERVHRIKGSFAAIEHRFLRDGFWQSLSHHELLLYFFLVLVGDRDGVSFYSYDRIITLLHLRLDEYVQARDALIAKDLIAFDGHLFQVLSLPETPMSPLVCSRPRRTCSKKTPPPSSAPSAKPSAKTPTSSLNPTPH